MTTTIPVANVAAGVAFRCLPEKVVDRKYRVCQSTGMIELSPRERQVAGLVAEGQSADEIAAALGISKQTVKNTKANIYAKLGARNAPHMIRLLAEQEVPPIVA